MAKPLFQKTVLVGTGLIGASLGRDLLRLGLVGEIVGLDWDAGAVRRAKVLRGVSRVGKDWKKELSDAALVILALPVRGIRLFLRDHANQIGPQAIVMDVGSTKRRILNDAERMLATGRFIGCHPMAGREKSGPQASRDGLFEGRTCFITPSAGAKAADVKKITRLWRQVGAQTVLIGAALHDKVLAGISHLPHAAAFALVAAVAGEFARNQATRNFLGGGFLDTTRVAGSSPAIWRDIFLENDRNLLAGLARLRKELGRLENAIRNRDDAALQRYLTKVSNLRRSLG